MAPPREILARLRLVCMELPEAVEESAWEGIRWCVRGKNFAHVLMIDGRPAPGLRTCGRHRWSRLCAHLPAGAEACAAARFRRAPFFRPVWFPNIAGLIVDARTDWDEVDALLKDSYRVLAPKKLATLVE